MASQRILSLLLFIANYCSLSLAAPWIVTKYIQQLEPAAGETTTTRQWVTLTVDSPEAIRTTTTRDYDFGTEDDVTFVNVLVEPSQGEHFTNTRNFDYHYYYVHVTQTWPDSCSPSSGTYTTESSIRVPYQIDWAIHPTATSAVVTQDFDDEPSTSSKLYINPTDVPDEVMSSALADPVEFFACNAYDDYPPFDDEPWRCYNYTWRGFGVEIGGGTCCPDGCHRTWGIEPWHLAPIIICSWFGFWLIIGIVYNIVCFRKLMMGERATRGLPGPFICLLPIISCLLLCVTRKGYEARPPAERAELRSKWEAMSIWTKARLWFRWGFSYKYPPFLGTAPPKYSFRHPNAKDQYATTTEMTATTTNAPTTTQRGADSPIDPPPPTYSAN